MRRLLLAVFLACGFSYSFNGANHELLTKAAFYQSLEESHYSSIIELVETIPGGVNTLIGGSSLPDRKPLTDTEMQQYSSLPNYDFDQWVDSQFETLVDKYIGHSGFLVDMARDKVKAVLRKEFVGEEQTLRFATQHTYVADPATSDDHIAEFFGQITVSPYAAQAEFNMAIEALNGKSFQDATITEKLNAIQRLGRVLHYIQDITSPSSCELGGNVNDLFLEISEKKGGGSWAQNLFEKEHIESNFRFNEQTSKLEKKNSSGIFETYRVQAWKREHITHGRSIMGWTKFDLLTPTQRCKDMYFDPNIYSYNQYHEGDIRLMLEYGTNETIEMVSTGFSSSSPFKFSLDMNNQTIHEKIVSLRNTMYQSDLIDWCDGIPAYSPYFFYKVRERGNQHYALWEEVGPGGTRHACGASFAYLIRQILYSITLPKYIHPSNQTGTEGEPDEVVGVDDNLEYVSDFVVPLAVTNSAKVITKFFTLTAGVEKDVIDMTPINMLLLD